ncbi:MAG: hypothetical protein ACO3RM_10110 [Paracoccaceae bacterium]|nr:hypothetical protein [Rhodobacterales bacterium]NCX55118.1 hypothetical protein [Rhodobacterales bacterium]NCX59376.1 hypothetical protein [Paracoccaceae bacterium]
MTKTEMKTRYKSVLKEIEDQKRASSAQSYSAGASILLYLDSKGFETAAVYAKLFLIVLGLFAAFYMTTQN